MNKKSVAKIKDSAIRMIFEGTASETGERFFMALVENLARTLNTKGAWVTEYREDRQSPQIIASWNDGEI